MKNAISVVSNKPTLISDKYVALGYSALIIIKRSKMHFYIWGDNSKRWRPMKDGTRNIPNNDGLLFFETSLGVIKGKKIQFYSFPSPIIHAPGRTFDIPDNDGILAFELGTLGIIKGKKIQFYNLNFHGENLDSGYWKLNPNIDFDIPDYDGIFPVGFASLGIIKGKKIKFYTCENEHWALSTDLPAFDIPDNDGIFPGGSTPELTYLGIVKGKKIEYYFAVKQHWVLDPTFTFEIPE